MSISFGPNLVSGLVGAPSVGAGEQFAALAAFSHAPASVCRTPPAPRRGKSMARRLAGLVSIATLLATPLAASADEAANEALARRFYAEVNARNIDAFDAFIAPDFVDHSAAPGAPNGVASVKADLRGFVAAFPDLKIENDRVIAKGDYVTVVSSGKGTNTGPLMGMAPTGKPVQMGAIDVWFVKDGKLAEAWHVEQLLQMMMQIGAMPAAK